MSRRFSTVLIANRGEIACRVILSARQEGYRTVAVYSDADARARHVDLADEAVHIGPSTVNESYLNFERVLNAAKRSGAQAIHPGYGFLSENAAFAEACADNGIIFVGPPPAAIDLMGNKAQAKRAMIEAGVPCVPGYEGADQDDTVLENEAKRIGFPVLLKAAAGGGGRGMRRVNDAAGFKQAPQQARSEALNAFGSQELIIEKLIENGRHVEIQVFGDEHGHVIHLGERDCSVQRRHQKVIEEAPCPVMTTNLRESMGAAAVAAAKAAGYSNAGTVEFLLDPEGNFYFLEMNTRLQVEHPVTELVTGLDLVALQLAVAQGEPLGINQEDVTLTGHAIEARLYAEDPSNDFAPQTGPVHVWEPAEGAGIRVDYGLKPGSAITPFYDAMVAKVIAAGSTRDEALARLQSALRNTSVLGVRTNRSFLLDILADDSFAAGEATTAFIETSGVLDKKAPARTLKQLLVAAAILIERDAAAMPRSLRGWRSTGPVTVPLKLDWEGETIFINVVMQARAYSVSLDEQEENLEVISMTDGRFRFRTEGWDESVGYALAANDLYVDWGNYATHIVDRTYAPPAASEQAAAGTLRAPMVGQVVELNVAEGDSVEEGQVVVVLEAMKMINHVTAPITGVVESVSINVGDHVEANRVMLVIAAPATADQTA